MSPETIALIALFITAVAAPFIANWQNNQLAIGREKRAEIRQDKVARLAVTAAKKVQQVAEKLEKSDAVSAAQGAEVLAIGKATHKLVNNQRTEMLRGFAVTMRAIAKEHPDDVEIVAAATEADKALAANIKENADPETKVGTPVKVEVVNAEPVQVDQVEKKK